MRGAVAERRLADFDIPASPPRVCSHIRRADAGASSFSWGQRWNGARCFEADAKNWALDPILAERILLPLRSATAYVWTHVMICVEANFPPASARVRSAHVWTYLYSTVCSGVDQRKHLSSALLAFVRGIHRWPVISPHKGPVARNLFPLDDVIMILLSFWFGVYLSFFVFLSWHADDRSTCISTNFNMKISYPELKS